MPFSATVLSWLVLAALVLAGLALLVALAALRRAGIRRGRGPRPVRRRPQALPRGKTTPLSSDEVSAEIQNVRVKTPPGEVASSLLSVTVFPPADRWALDANSTDQLTAGRADAYAYVIVTRADGSHYHPPCYNDVRLQP